MRDLLIKCKTKSEKTAAASMLYGFGYIYCSEYTTLESFIENVIEDDDEEEFPHVTLEWDKYGKGYEINTVSDSYVPELDAVVCNLSSMSTILKFLEKPEPTKVKVRISKDYEAIITKDNLVVGCQTIEWDDFDKLVEATKKVRKA